MAVLLVLLNGYFLLWDTQRLEMISRSGKVLLLDMVPGIPNVQTLPVAEDGDSSYVHWSWGSSHKKGSEMTHSLQDGRGSIAPLMTQWRPYLGSLGISVSSEPVPSNSWNSGSLLFPNAQPPRNRLGYLAAPWWVFWNYVGCFFFKVKIYISRIRWSII